MNLKSAIAETKVKIFIASSAEVKQERESCINHLNQINKSHKHLHLESVEWEYDMPFGSFPNFKDVQEAINPKLKESTFCVFIFYSKIGKYTLEEFELANKLGKKIFIFFKDDFSPKSKDELDKYGELLNFKESMNDTILYKNYTTLKTFELHLKDDLHLYLANEFPVPTVTDNKPLSSEVTTLMKILTEKQDEIERLKKSGLSLADEGTNNKLQTLEKEKNDLLEELNKNKEIQEQQAKEKQELETILATQIARDNLKEKALTAIKENKYDDAERLLKESAKDSISETASTFYELGKLKKIQLLYKDALHYFELAVNIKPQDFDLNMETGIMLRDLGYDEKAIMFFERALKEFKPGQNLINSKISNLNNELGRVYDNLGKYDKAIRYYEKAIAIDEKLYEEENPQIGVKYNNLGLAYNNKGEYDKAIGYYEKALVIYKKFYGEEHPSIAVTSNNIGLVYSHKGEYDKALKYFGKALAIDIKSYGEEHPDTAIDYNNLGLAYSKKGEHDKAISYYEQALAIDNKFYGEEHPQIAIRYNNIGMVYNNKGEYDKAISFCEKALLIDKKFYGEEHPNIAIRYNNIGTSYLHKTEYEKAIDYYEKAFAILNNFLPSNHQNVVTVKENLEFCLNQINK